MGKYLIEENKVNRGQMLLFPLAFAFVNSFVYYFISQERYIYFWDYYHYWAKYQNLGDLMIHSPLKAFSEIWRTLRYEDYNLLPVLFLMPIRLLFGTSRLTYVLAVANVYAFPAAVLSAFLVTRIVSSDKKKSYIPIGMALATSLLFPQYWIPVLFGFPDVAGVVVIYVIFLLVVIRPFEEQKMASLVLLGVLLAFLIMLRRWYAYWVVSFFVAIAAQRLLALFPRHHFRIRNYLPAARNLIIAGMISSGFFLLAATPIAKRMITTDYADIYSAYKMTDAIIPFLKDLSFHLGLFTSSLFAAALAFGIVQRRSRDLSVFLLFHLVCVVFLFSRVQSFSVQHYYLIIPSMVLSISVLAVSVSSYLHKVAARSIVLAGYIAALALQFWLVFVPQSSGRIDGIAPIFSRDRHYPMVRNDLGEIRKLLDALETNSHGGEDGVYVIASSTIFSDDILRNACRAFDYPQLFCNRILGSSHVDKRDGFPKNFLSAGYVVVAEPVQYHLRPEDQRVIGILAEQMHLKSGIGSSFDALNYEFLLDNNVNVHIYKKMKPFDSDALQQLEYLYVTYYPDKKEIFTIPGIHKGSD